MHLMPAVRTATGSGRLDVSWFSRSSPTTALTSVDAVLGLNPRRAGTPTFNVRITSAASNWINVSTDIAPNFGDYTDASMVTTSTAPYVGRTLYIAWSDGRLGVPQPFMARLPAG